MSAGAVAFTDPELQDAVKNLVHKIANRAGKLSKTGHVVEFTVNLNALTVQVIGEICDLTINAQAKAVTGLTRDEMQRREDDSVRRHI